MKQEHSILNSNSAVTVNWTRPRLAAFKQAFALAEKEHRDTLVFNNCGYTVGYAHYLITFLEGELK